MNRLAVPAPVLAVLALAAAAPPATASAAGCAPTGSTLISRDNDVRVYSTKTALAVDEFNIRTWVCSDRTGKRAVLASRGLGPTPSSRRGTYVGSMRFAGRYFAAVEENTGGANGPEGEPLIHRVDLDTGEQERTRTCPDCPSGRVGFHVTDLVVTRKGWIAWIASTRIRKIGPSPNIYAVGRRDSRGIKQVDFSNTVERRSLADSGTTIFWISQGGPQDEDLY